MSDHPPPHPGGHPPPAPPAGTNTMAVLALVFAILLPPLGIVFGHLAGRQIRRTGETGGGLAVAGLVLGYVFVGLALLGCCGALIVAAGGRGGR
ncbi:MAG TPA: DUF4190 domain-containing protein [Pilimelia sp.]|nr:DUF4190 domain-containing protein [Pilimelia sp.]